MTNKERTSTHRRLVAAGFRRAANQPRDTYVMPAFPDPKLHIDKPLESNQDVIEIVFWWGHCVGEAKAREEARKALGL